MSLSGISEVSRRSPYGSDASITVMPTMTPPETRRPWASDDDLPPTPPPVPPTRDGGGAPRRRAPLVALVLLSAAIGGGASAGVLSATGAFDSTTVRTVTTTAAATTTTPAAETTTASGTGLDAKAVYANAAPGVVSITAKGVSSSESAPVSPFGGPSPSQGTAVATGTGFLYDTDGHILTAEHVVDGASSIVVTLQDGTKRTAQLLGSDNATDVAVLKIDPTGLDIQPLTLGSSAGLDIGDEVAAIGDPFGYARSISTGIASGLDRTIQAPNGFTVAHAVQTDAALNPGNSGGPLVDANGKVIGIVDQIATGGSGSDQSSGVGFAVPIDLVAGEVKNLEAGSDVKHAYIGVSTGDATSTATGATVGSVVAGGPAENAGIRQGDIVTNIDGKTIDTSTDLVAAIASHKPGDAVTVTLRRGGSTVTKTVTLGTQPAQSPGG
jgi:putative serine protease PepD